MTKKLTIPEQDLTDINVAFSKKPKDQIIKKADGAPIKAQGGIVDSQGYVMKNYVGKVLRHDKKYIPVGISRTITVGKKGQRYEDIAKQDREKVSWRDSDFI